MKIRKDTDGTLILSSIESNSKCSTNETIAPAINPATPKILPVHIENAAIAKFPHQNFVLCVYMAFLATPVNTSPTAMKSVGSTAIQKLPPEINHPIAGITPHIRTNVHSHLLSSI